MGIKLMKTRWQDWPLAAKGAAIVSLPIALLIATMYSSYLSQREISRADSEVLRTLQVQTDIQALHTLIAEAASGVRGFLLTGREEFLSPYWMAQDRLPETLSALKREMRDPVQTERLTRASDLVSAKLESLNTLRIRGSQFEQAALQSHLTHSKQILDDLREQISLLRERETQLLGQRSDVARNAKRRDAWLSLTTISFAIAGAAFALWMLLTGIVRRVQQVAANAERLVSGLPLVQAPMARDEVGVLAERLQAASVLLAERAEQSQSASRAKTEFLSRTSHELRTPLNAILGFAQLLEIELKSTPQATSVGQVLSAGRHLVTLIDDVLDIARIEAGEIKLALESVALQPLLQEAYTLISPLAAHYHIEIQLPERVIQPTAAPGTTALLEPKLGLEHLHVLADRQRLRQVLLNVLSNAVKYNRAQGRVWISVFLDPPNSIRVAIADNGLGIRSDKLQRLFEPFERLDAERLAVGVEGTGLGLAISRQLMERMQGAINVQSTLDEGSVFTLQLTRSEPVAAREHTPAPQEAKQTPSQSLRHLLCVEDNASNVALIQALLAKRPNWRLHIACSGAEALRQAHEEPFDWMLLDLHLPDVSGEVVLRQLRQTPAWRTRPIVILSANAMPESLEHLRAAGATDYWTKPLDIPKLFALLDRLEQDSAGPNESTSERP